jgi:hypothetical protein
MLLSASPAAADRRGERPAGGRHTRMRVRRRGIKALKNTHFVSQKGKKTIRLFSKKLLHLPGRCYILIKLA